jgi:hypothetical protein
MERISLSECVVVGKYLRYDPQVRHTLQDWVQRIQAPLSKKTKARENFLIWAAPGSGKTFLIQQIADSLGNSVAYVECNLAKDNREDFIHKVNTLSSHTRPVLCLLDEIDARSNEVWPYEECFSKLDLNVDTAQQVVIVLIGSTQSSVHAMEAAMKQRQKGADLVSRVPHPNAFEIPSMAQEDTVVMAVGQILALLGERVKSVEKYALLYILCNESLRNSPRQLSEFMKAAAYQFKKQDRRLRFHHLFQPGAQEMFNFRQRHDPTFLKGLQEVDVQISR